MDFIFESIGNLFILAICGGQDLHPVFSQGKDYARGKLRKEATKTVASFYY